GGEASVTTAGGASGEGTVVAGGTAALHAAAAETTTNRFISAKKIPQALRCFDDAHHDRPQLLARDRLLEARVGHARQERARRGGEGAAGGEDDLLLQPRPALADLLVELRPIHARHGDVDEHRIEADGPADDVERLVAAPRHHHVVVAAQDALERAGHAVVVVDDEHARPDVGRVGACRKRDDRQPDAEQRAAAALALDLERAAVRLDGVAGDREAE